VKNVIRAIALLLVASLTIGYEREVSWTPPTQYEDGSILLEQDLDYYTLYCDDEAVTTIDSIIGTRTALLDMPEAPGTHECWLTVTSLAGEESAPSNVLSFMNQYPAPNPPVVQW